MRILALDISELGTGYCFGESGTTPRPKKIIPKKAGERLEDAAARFARWLRDMIESGKPELITMERYLPSGALPNASGSMAREAAVGLQFVVRAVAACYGIPVRAPTAAQIRTHFCGAVSGAGPRARGAPPRTAREIAEARALTKQMVIRRAIQLGYMPTGSTDDNEADAAALFDFSSSTFGKQAVAFALI